MTTSPIGLIGVGLLGTALAERMLAAGHCARRLRPRPARAAAESGDGGAASAARGRRPLRDRSCCACPIRRSSPRSSSSWATAAAGIAADRRHHGRSRRQRLAWPRELQQPRHRLRRCHDRRLQRAGPPRRSGRDDRRRSRPTSQRAEPVLATWSDRRFHVGPPGSGARMKLVVNLVLGLNRAVLAEGLALAEACGIDPAAALDVLKATPAYSAGDGHQRPQNGRPRLSPAGPPQPAPQGRAADPRAGRRGIGASRRCPMFMNELLAAGRGTGAGRRG